MYLGSVYNQQMIHFDTILSSRVEQGMFMFHESRRDEWPESSRACAWRYRASSGSKLATQETKHHKGCSSGKVMSAPNGGQQF